jgi:hypothetical protein
MEPTDAGALAGARPSKAISVTQWRFVAPDRDRFGASALQRNPAVARSLRKS